MCVGLLISELGALWSRTLVTHSWNTALLANAPWTTQRPSGALRGKHSSPCEKKPRKKTLDPLTMLELQDHMQCPQPSDKKA